MVSKTDNSQYDFNEMKAIIMQCRETKSVYAIVCEYIIRQSARSHCT